MSLLGRKIFIFPSLMERAHPMKPKPYRTTLFVLYQLSIAAGIALLPFALAVRRFGVALPVHRVVKTLEAAYEQSAAESNV